MPVDLSRIGLEGQQAFYDRAQTAANARNLEANAVKNQQENAERAKLEALGQEAARRLQDLAQGKRGTAGPDPEALADSMDSLADPLEMVADIYMKGGAIETGTDMLKSASEIRKREADMENDKVVNQQNRLENILKGAEIVGQRFGTAMNQDEWNLAIEETRRDLEAGVFSMEPEMFEQISQMEFDPDVAAFFRDRAISVTDQAKLEMRQLTQDRMERDRVFRQQNSTRLAELAEARHQEAKRHNEVMEKASGGKSATTPTAQQLASVRSVLENSVFKGVKTKSDPDVADATQYVAGQALGIIKDNSAITWDTAVRQATMRAQEAGMFGAKADGFWEGWLGKKSDPTFGEGATPEKAIALPAAKTELVKGRYYITAKGRAKWNGSSFVLAK